MCDLNFVQGYLYRIAGAMPLNANEINGRHDRKQNQRGFHALQRIEKLAPRTFKVFR